MFYGLSGYFAAHSQHVGMFQTAAWLPDAGAAAGCAGERLSWPRLALAGLLGAALALPGHFQVALYAFSGAGAVGAARRRRCAADSVAPADWSSALLAVAALGAAAVSGS